LAASLKKLRSKVLSELLGTLIDGIAKALGSSKLEWLSESIDSLIQSWVEQNWKQRSSVPNVYKAVAKRSFWIGISRYAAESNVEVAALIYGQVKPPYVYIERFEPLKAKATSKWCSFDYQEDASKRGAVGVMHSHIYGASQKDEKGGFWYVACVPSCDDIEGVGEDIKNGIWLQCIVAVRSVASCGMPLKVLKEPSTGVISVCLCRELSKHATVVMFRPYRREVLHESLPVAILYSSCNLIDLGIRREGGEVQSNFDQEARRGQAKNRPPRRYPVRSPKRRHRTA